jgi:hypothetical protein
MKRIALSLFTVVIVAGVGVGRAQVTRTDAKPAPQSAKRSEGDPPRSTAIFCESNCRCRSLLNGIDNARTTSGLLSELELLSGRNARG